MGGNGFQGFSSTDVQPLHTAGQQLICLAQSGLSRIVRQMVNFNRVFPMAATEYDYSCRVAQDMRTDHTLA